MEYSEIKALKSFSENITVRQYGRGCFIINGPEKIDIEMARKGFEEIAGLVINGGYDLVILDEINIAIHFGFLTVQNLVNLIKKKSDRLELVLTGRQANQEIIEIADLVTEMKEVKHYFTNGVMARKGIER